MKLNRIVLIISVVIISIWMYNLYRNRCVRMEYYTAISSKLRKHLTSDEKLKYLLVTNSFVQMDVDKDMLREVMDLAKIGDRNALLALLDKVETAKK